MIKSKQMSQRKYKKFFFEKIIFPESFTYRTILKYLPEYKKRGENVLDAGCGEGNISFYLANKNKKVTAIDISQKTILECKEKAQKLQLIQSPVFKQGNIEKQKFNNKFDLIICVEVIEHVKKPILMLKNLQKHLKPGGLLFLTTPSKDAPLFKIGIIKKYDQEIGHLRRYTPQELKKILKSLKFQIVKTRETEGILKNFLFFNKINVPILKFINKLAIMATIVNAVDDFMLKIFGASQIIIIAKKQINKK